MVHAFVQACFPSSLCPAWSILFPSSCSQFFMARMVHIFPASAPSSLWPELSVLFCHACAPGFLWPAWPIRFMLLFLVLYGPCGPYFFRPVLLALYGPHGPYLFTPVLLVFYVLHGPYSFHVHVHSCLWSAWSICFSRLCP